MGNLEPQRWRRRADTKGRRLGSRASPRIRPPFGIGVARREEWEYEM